MKRAALIIFIFSLVLLLFGYLGYFTARSHRRYDEMDGLYPFFALLIGGFLMLISMMILLIHKLKK